MPLKWADLARNCARASLVKPSAPLAAKGREVLLRLSDYTFEFEHYDVGMNYTIWALAALDAYDILYADFTPAERRRLDIFFARYLDALTSATITGSRTSRAAGSTTTTPGTSWG